MPVQNFHSDNSSTKVIVSGTIQECQINSLANVNTENLAADLDTSKASFERKEQDNMKAFVPLSQGGKLVPKFPKRRKTLAKEHEENFGGAITTGTEKGDCMDRNVTSTAENYVENTVASSETPEAADSLVTKVKDAGDQVIIHCEELSKRQDVKMQDEDKIRRINNGGANSGLADSCQGTGTASNLQESICEKEVSGNKDVDGLSLEPFKCQFVKEMSISILAEDSVTDHIKSTPHEELLDTSDMSMDKNKAFHDITNSDDVTEANWTKNRSCKDASLVERMFSQTQKENNRTYFPLETGLSFLTPGEQSKHLNTSSVSSDGDTDVKKADQGLPYRRGESEEQSVICSSTEMSEHQVTLCSSTMSEKGTEKHNLWSIGKPVEQNGMSKTASQSNPCMEETIVAEQNSVQGQNTSRKDFLDIQSMSIYLEKQADLSESKCEQVFETNDMFLPQSNGDVHPESSTISVQAVICSEETGRNKKESEMKARPAKSTTASPDPEVPVLQTQKKNGSERLVSDTKQSEFSTCDLEPPEIREVLSGISQQNLTETAKAETNPTENSSADIYMEGKEEMVTCENNKNKPPHEENYLSSVKVLPAGDPGREMNAGSEMQKSLLVLGTSCSRNAPIGLDTMTQTCSPCTDPPSLDMEILSNSQRLGIFEFPPHKTSFLDNPHSPSEDKSDQCAAGEPSGNKTPIPAINLIYPNSDRNEVTEGICDPYKQEDATDVVCGLIKELSNLNRLIMSTHRDLDSFKRLKFRRNRQSGKLVPHSVSNVTSTLCTVKKKREI
ncbi:break repair meiotic recombinase recruitment factor 1 [Zootoca vivipara]|uniref:break repair meiotic recombinase recruitment factor 1 n=1 Tax=Zootoca vivipara TaxID=8524 RepID=UPI00293BAC37|nr:break repair meiotic recombinase recruitment factor 1 [Zootoca vivipara]